LIDKIFEIFTGYYKPDPNQEYTENSPGGDFDFLSKLVTDWEKGTEMSSADVRVVKVRSGKIITLNVSI
jgi:NAD dependent epimerase/dehydratase family enzyme